LFLRPFRSISRRTRHLSLLFPVLIVQNKRISNALVLRPRTPPLVAFGAARGGYPSPPICGRGVGRGRDAECKRICCLHTIDGLAKNPKSADLSLRAKRSNLITALILRRLPRRFAPRNDAGGLFTNASTHAPFCRSPLSIRRMPANTLSTCHNTYV
jgi:hypothetical protein